jgi:hypothetical protein
MALAFQRDEISVECTGTVTTVPNNDVARLMYYLNCVCTVIDCNHDPDIQRFTNYRNWSYLTVSEQAQLLVVCYTFSPDVFNNQVFFHSDELCGNSSNEFFRINQVSHRLIAAESIVIAGQTREVNQIMTYKMAWMRNNYYEPMQRLATRFENASRSTATYGSVSSSSAARQPITYTPPVIRQPVTYTNHSKPFCTSCRLFAFICCILIAVPAIIGIVYAIIEATK